MLVIKVHWIFMELGMEILVSFGHYSGGQEIIEFYGQRYRGDQEADRGGVEGI